jgi:hypothetical protein
MHGRARDTNTGRIYRDPATGKLKCTCCQNLLCCSTSGVAMGLVQTPWRCRLKMQGTIQINFSGGASSSSLPLTAFNQEDIVTVPATTRCGGAPTKTWLIPVSIGTLRLEAQGWVDQFTGTGFAPTCAGGGGSFGPGSSQPWVNPGFAAATIPNPGLFGAGVTVAMVHRFAHGANPSSTLHGVNRWNGGTPIMRTGPGCTAPGTYTYNATPFFDLPSGANYRKFGFNGGGASWDFRGGGSEQLILTISEFSAELMDHFDCPGADGGDEDGGELLLGGVPGALMVGSNFNCEGCGG